MVENQTEKIIEREINKYLNTKFLPFIKSHLKTLDQRINKRIDIMLTNISKNIITEELKKIDPPQIIIDRFDELTSQKFTPLVESIYIQVHKRISKYIRKELRTIINLKTSTISDISLNIPNPMTEEEVLKENEKIKLEGDMLFVE